MDADELIKTAVTAVIAVIAKELLAWLITTRKKLPVSQEDLAGRECVVIMVVCLNPKPH